MRGLAEFIMRGRWQALAVAVLGAGSLLFGWISAAAVALVTLRKGAGAGGWIVMWALLPALLVVRVSGDSSTVLLLVGTFLLALVLRTTVSLAMALVTSVVVGLASGGSLLLLDQEFLSQLVQMFNEVVSQLEAGLNSRGDAQVELIRPTPTQVAGMLAAGNGAMSVVSLLLGRYWQAMLYNPGGFGTEFRALRLPPVWTLLLAAATVALWLQGVGYSGWAMVLAVPLVFCGFALAHDWAGRAGKSSSWLAMLYVLWLVFDPVKGVLLVLVLVDAIINLRDRWRPPQDGGAA